MDVKWLAEQFKQKKDLAAKLLTMVNVPTDGAHDFAHTLRVWRNATMIMSEEGGDEEIVCAAVILHDCIQVEKDSALRSQASMLAALEAERILVQMGWQEQRRQAVTHAVVAHSFSANISPATLEARVVRDADRLDALGAVGVARLFYVAGRMGSGLYDPVDIQGQHRVLDDRAFALDHFRTKLAQMLPGFVTATGSRVAFERMSFTMQFLAAFERDVCSQ